MFELTRPWWEIIARAAIIYVGLFLVLRLFGKRQLGEFTPFDLIFLLLVSDSVSRALVGGDRSLSAAFLAHMLMWGLLFLLRDHDGGLGDDIEDKQREKEDD